MRCVFEDTGMYGGLVRELQLRNLAHGLLGDRYEPLSVDTESGTDHVDLIDTARMERHLDALVSGRIIPWRGRSRCEAYC